MAAGGTGDEGTLNVLSFVDDVLNDRDALNRLAPGYAGTRLRRMMVDGTPLHDLVPDLGGGADEAKVLLHPKHIEDGEIFLKSLIGGPPADPLRGARIGLAFCGLCGDSSCGQLLAGELKVEEDRVRWRHVGPEREHFGEFAADGSTIPPPEWWTPEPFEPEVTFTFERAAYEATIRAELEILERVHR